MSYTISLDGFGAGPEQSLEKPMGLGAENLHHWLRHTRRFAQMVGQEGGSVGIDNDFAERGFENLGAWIMGRNMFGPIRGEWPDLEWKGWWGANPPYHVPVFVLTHHPREPLVMEGGTTFYFVTEGIDACLEMAKAAAQGKDVRVGGGADTIRQLLQGGHIDEVHLALSPILLGKGEHLFGGIDLPALGYGNVERVEGEYATHVLIRKG